jgi:hypothetical protein
MEGVFCQGRSTARPIGSPAAARSPAVVVYGSSPSEAILPYAAYTSTSAEPIGGMTTIATVAAAPATTAVR